jgi:hypothetical protein
MLKCPAATRAKGADLSGQFTGRNSVKGESPRIRIINAVAKHASLLENPPRVRIKSNVFAGTPGQAWIKTSMFAQKTGFG